MNIFDIIFAIIGAIAIWTGYRKGLIVELCGIIGVILGIYISYNYHDVIFEKLNITNETTKLISYGLIVIAVLIIVYIIAKTLSKLLDLTGLGFINYFLGAVVSIIKYALVTSIFLSIFDSLNSNFKWVNRSTIDKSICYSRILNISEEIFPFALDYTPNIDKTIDDIKKGVENSVEKK
ncbi:MAG: CvpA family protein [Rikenellaceae bacterium]